MTIQSQLDQVLADLRDFRHHCEEWHEPDVDKWISRLSAIRAAVGGEAVDVDAEARRLFELNSAGWAVKAGWDELHPQTRELWHAHALKNLSAAVGVGALRELVDKWRAREGAMVAQYSEELKRCVDELAALIGEKA